MQTSETNIKDKVVGDQVITVKSLIVKMSLLANARICIKKTFHGQSFRLLHKTFASEAKITSAIPTNDRYVRVTWNAKKQCDFPHIFLRDNCQCPECFDISTKQRTLITVNEIDLHVKPKHVHVDNTTNEVAITWPNDHKSVFSGDWLLKRKFPENENEIKPIYLHGLKTKLWPEKFQESLPFIEYDELINDDNTLIKHIENVMTLGLSIVRGAPTKPNVIADAMAKRMSMGFSKTTHYGRMFTVKSKPSPSNVAYTPNFLALHADQPYLKYQPEIQLLHCIEQSAGENAGVNHIADGFKAATALKEKRPDLFDVLTKVKFMFYDVGSDKFGDFDYEYERPVISLNGMGEIDGVAQNNPSRSAFVNAKSEDVYKSYEANYALMNSLYDNNNVINYKMSPGDILTFNNKRVLHGRSAYDPTTTTRWLEGIYFDFDEVLSKYRVIKTKVQNSDS